LILVRVYYKNNKGNEGKGKTKHRLQIIEQHAGNVIQVWLIPEFNTLPMPDGSGPT